MSPPEAEYPKATDKQAVTMQSEEWQTIERKYYRRDGLFIKRTLRPSECHITPRGTVFEPPLAKERLQNRHKTHIWLGLRLQRHGEDHFPIRKTEVDPGASTRSPKI